MNNSQYNTRLIEGIVGVVFTTATSAMSVITDEHVLRVASLWVGIIVGCLTAFRLLRGKH